MLYQLLYPLSKYISGFNLFRYITFRMAYATVTAMLISFLFGNVFIEMLKRYQVKENIRTDGPKTHLMKEGTPTMGGLLILISIIIPSLFWADLSNRYIQLILLVTLWLGGLGFMDDYLKAKRKERKGLVARKKFIGQIALGLILGTILYLYPPDPNFTTATDLPFFKNYYLSFGILYIPFVVLVITGASNAVNLTDGLDGLAIGLVGICALTFAGLCYVTGRIDFSRYLNIQYLHGAGELAVFCGALMGACLGFLWFNANPAKVFMGDTGALALGGALGALALLVKKEMLLVIIGGVFVLEAASVIIQVIYFKMTGKRVFKMAPLHHHFELSGWKEQQVVVRFWILGVICALLTLSTLKIR
ncbi:MAG TPA: phospho-N-acetylmuramoyl-pentapeptide-transferase [candidate division Zixibacteria bacterium]|jgi:phospho-N-acetylmuramoyl-pentapeptide-transferase|nr:phospho-N-acetylmuramoyl-pentapeptide-transferase [candidate division Zixibacteria bacterium]HBZ01501.1 phospho-N-acetylmuramoyl-pentapeptide-transferase [candidate division Zixibacteria bacterium]